MAADTDRPANVQAYLDKHKISSLFETLTSQLVKDLPADPLGFLILKLQGFKKKAPVSSSSSKPATSTGLRKPTATSTSGATGARKPVSSSSSVASSRSASSRPATSSSSGIAKPPSAKTRPSSIKQSSSTAPDTKASSSRAPGGSKIPRSPVKPVKSGVAGKPSAPPTSAPPTGTAKTRKPASATTTTRAASAATKSKPDHDSKLTKPSSSSLASKPSSASTSSKESRVTKSTAPSLPAPTPAPAPVPVPVPIAPPSSSDHELSDDDDTQQLVVLDYDSDDEQEQYHEEEEDKEEFDINTLVLKLKRSKGPNKRHRDHLSVASGLLHTCSSSGYQSSEDEPWDDEQDEDEEGGLDVAESATVLELEEGITLPHQARIIAKKLPRPDPVINLNVMVCGRCGNIMNQDSASQVDGSHVTFPQWDDTTSTLTSKPGDSVSTSWHGVGQVPLVSCIDPSTDETSDLMVPDTVPAAQQPRSHEDQELEEDEEMMIGGEDQL